MEKSPIETIRDLRQGIRAAITRLRAEKEQQWMIALDLEKLLKANTDDFRL